jgi:diacylglycerol kinase (ATP)|tara:strand:- start:864 stop:1232 length:369 start_codon:yes stop_codon:yes gene_type:complete
MKPGEQGVARIISATRYSWLGLKAAWLHEAAFRQEAGVALIGLPLAIWLARDAVEFLLLVMPLFILMLTELVNSAIEAAIDRFGGEHHELSGRAKDMGSAAVFMAIMLTCLSWITVIGDIYL